MSVINVTDDYRIVGSEHCWTVERFHHVAGTGDKRRESGERVYQALSYHRTIGDAARSLAHRHVRCADVEGVALIMAQWDEITSQINDAVMPTIGKAVI